MFLPSFQRSSVDGFAVRASDTFGASESMPGFLNMIGKVEMGQEVRDAISPGQTMYVPTGGMLPANADAMLMIEHAEENDDLICAYKQIAPLENVIQVGEDFTKGALLFKKGTKIRSQEIGALAANGITEVSVYRKPVLAYLSTGDEIVPSDISELPLGKIRDMNAVTIESAAREMGCDFIYGGIIKDEGDALQKAAAEFLSKSDCLILSGGSSVGTKDYSVGVLDSLGSPGVYVHGISIKPGKPTIIGSADGKPVIGLPGHPASALVIFQTIGSKIVNLLRGATESTTATVYAKSSKKIASAVGRTDYIRVTLTKKDNFYFAEPIHGKSGLISTLVECNGLLYIPENKEGIEKDEIAEVVLQ
ncbi:MAG: molybdenum cofactor synthesis protein [Bacillales bacterium]|nr:molybdenum cofactor synthesis protein [Bacillales bacterium]